MDDFMFDISMNCGLGFESFNPFAPAFPAASQMHEAYTQLDPSLDVSGFGLAEWKQYDPYNLDIRNPYVGGYPTLGGDWDPLLDYDPYAPHIYENMQAVTEMMSNQNTLSSLPSVNSIDASMMPIPNLTPNSGSCLMYGNPFSGGMSADEHMDLMHDMGLIRDEDYNFLLTIFPRHSHASDMVTTTSEPSLTQLKLDESNSIERERDTAVENYNDAKRSGNYEEMLKWETIANDRQQDLYNLWDTPQYGLPAKAPGIA